MCPRAITAVELTHFARTKLSHIPYLFYFQIDKKIHNIVVIMILPLNNTSIIAINALFTQYDSTKTIK